MAFIKHTLRAVRCNQQLNKMQSLSYFFCPPDHIHYRRPLSLGNEWSDDKLQAWMESQIFNGQIAIANQFKLCIIIIMRGQLFCMHFSCVGAKIGLLGWFKKSYLFCNIAWKENLSKLIYSKCLSLYTLPYYIVLSIYRSQN